jgi:hypothetical protein
LHINLLISNVDASHDNKNVILEIYEYWKLKMFYNLNDKNILPSFSDYTIKIKFRSNKFIALVSEMLSLMYSTNHIEMYYDILNASSQSKYFQF